MGICITKGFRPLLFIAAVLAAGSATAATYTVGPAAAGCSYQDIATAVAAAKANPGPDLIKLASITFYPTAPIVVQDSGDLTIEGGYGTCDASVPLFDTTIDGTFMSPAAYLVAQGGGGGSLTLRWLQLQNSNGGAIDSVLSGPLTLEHVKLHSNNADYGAGLFVSGNSIYQPVLSIIDSEIYDNVAKNGGGVFLNFVDATIGGYFRLQHNKAVNGGAGCGGGVFAQDTVLNLNVHGSSIGLLDNSADGQGGAVCFERTDPSRSYEITVQSDDGSPVAISGNSAGIIGGAFYISADSSVSSLSTINRLLNTRITANTAGDGAAIYASANAHNAAIAVTNQVLLLQSETGDAVRPCSANIECNVIDSNAATNASTNEGILDVASARGGNVILTLNRARMRQNVGGALINGNGTAYVRTSLLTSNQLVNIPIIADNHTLGIWDTTIAANTMPANTFVIYAQGAALTLERSIIDQPGNSLCAAPLGSIATLKDLLLSPNTTNVGCTGSNVQTGLPSFVNPAAGDFHLQANSQAIDRWADTDASDPATPIDLDGALRPHVTVLASLPYDFGAYEYGAKINEIFKTGFEGQ